MLKLPHRLITYCTDIHPGESWRETFSALKKHVPAVKAAVSPDFSFPIGLRLSSRAAAELTNEENDAFRKWLEDQDCFVPTINGSWYGSLHGRVLKQRAYRHDWHTQERVDYTLGLAQLLAGWLPPGVVGSISTLPLGFRTPLTRFHDHLPEMRIKLQAVLSRLAAIQEEQGKTIVLALEPEPGCLLEVTEDLCNFFQALNLPPSLESHLGICYDCCHAAVQFEDPGESLKRLASTGIRLAKVQVSSALKVREDHPFLLSPYDEPFYLHQVVVRRRDGSLLSYDDLSDAIFQHHPRSGEEWRCNFHLPVFTESSGRIESTVGFLADLLPRLPREVLLEVETYTWEALPAELRRGKVTDSVIREIDWLKKSVHA